MKTRSGSGMDENWDENEEYAEKPLVPDADGKEQVIAPQESEKSDPLTDGLDDDPIDEPELAEDDNEEPEQENQVQDPPEELKVPENEIKPKKVDKAQEELPLFGTFLRVSDDGKKKEPLDLSNTHGSLGERIRKYRENAGLTDDDVYARTHIVQDYLRNLEEGNYSELNGKVYAARHLMTLCQCYGLDKSLQEELHELLITEYDKSGFGVRENPLPNPTFENGTTTHHSPWLNKLPGIIIGFLLVLLVLMILLAIVVPLLSKSRSNVSNPKDMAPLVVPAEQRPPVLPVPN